MAPDTKKSSQTLLNTPPEDYTLNFVVQRHYTQDLLVAREKILHVDLLDAADSHMLKLKTTQQLYYFLITWNRVLNPEIVKEIATKYKNVLLDMISADYQYNAVDSYNILKLLRFIANSLNWHLELEHEIIKLNKEVEIHIKTIICTNCKAKDMMHCEDTIVCCNCGVSWVL